LFNVIDTSAGGSHWSGGGMAQVSFTQFSKKSSPLAFRLNGSLTLNPSVGISGLNTAGTDEQYVARQVRITGEARLMD
jgi:hypothetical protein